MAGGALLAAGVRSEGAFSTARTWLWKHTDPEVATAHVGPHLVGFWGKVAGNFVVCPKVITIFERGRGAFPDENIGNRDGEYGV